MKTKHALYGLISGLLLLAAGTAQTHAGLLVPAAPGVQLYVGNYSNSIEKFTPGGVGSVFASTGLSGPFGLAFDRAGNLYAANVANNTIEKFTPGGVGSVFASTGLNVPVGLAFDSAGNLYAANSVNNTIEKFSSTGIDLGVFADSADGLDNPHGLAFDSAGNLYAGGTGNGAIWKITPGGVGSFFATTGVYNNTGLAFDGAGNLYVATYSGNTIRKFTPGGVGSVFANTGLNGPTGLAFDSAGNLFVSNYYDSTIREFSSSGTDLGVFADSSDGLSNPTYLAFAPVPEPGTALFGIACVGIAAFRRRRHSALRQACPGTAVAASAIDRVPD